MVLFIDVKMRRLRVYVGIKKTVVLRLEEVTIVVVERTTFQKFFFAETSGFRGKGFRMTLLLTNKNGKELGLFAKCKWHNVS